MTPLRLSRWYLFVGVLALSLFAALPAGNWRDNVLYDAIGASMVMAIGAGLWLNRPRARGTWCLFGLGGAFFVAGDIATAVYTWDGSDAPFPATQDVLYLIAYPLLLAALIRLVAARSSARNWTSLVDSAVLATAAALLTWVFLVAPSLRDSGATSVSEAVSLAYPAFDLLLLAVAIRIIFGAGRRRFSPLLLGAGVLLLLSADLSYISDQLQAIRAIPTLSSLAWLASYVLWGVAALHPSMTTLSEPTSEPAPQLTGRRFALLSAASLTAPAVLAVQEIRGASLEVPFIVGGSGALTLLVLARLAGLVVREQRDARRERLLRSAIGQLASADGHEAICQAAAEAAQALASEHGDVNASLILGSGRSSTVFATSGEVIEHPVRTSFPLTLGSERIGEMVVQSQHGLDEGVHEALAILGAQVVLAIESIGRTRSLLEERKQLESELVRRAHIDPLTGLPNRTYFLERVSVALDRMGHIGEPVSVLVVNLDDFKTVNDTLGHVAGDELLRSVSDRLVASIRTEDTCARLSGDEWGILIEESPPESPAAVADRIMTAMERAFVLLGQHDVFARASIGSATVDAEHDSVDGAELVRNAEVAMYHAKQHGRTGFEAFEPAMRAAVAERMELKAELERAVSAQEFVLAYQPIVLLETGEICGLEALIRWNHPKRGIIPPFHFIPLAEETGLIVQVGRFVLTEALRKACEWQELTGSKLAMSINISARQLDHVTFVGDVARALDETGIDPSTVILEITETALMEDVEGAIEHLREIKELGVQFAIDDFGTGYSSLQYLRQFPADIIKVAKPFVDGVVERGSDEYRIADAIVRLGQTFGLTALAEGIELNEQREMLCELHCELGQGFLFARPLDPEQVEKLLRKRGVPAAIPA
ncbi:MAG: EAL domain-containing protein [Gaiellaceae bacterium]